MQRGGQDRTNLLKRNFRASEADRIWLADISGANGCSNQWRNLGGPQEQEDRVARFQFPAKVLDPVGADGVA